VISMKKYLLTNIFFYIGCLIFISGFAQSSGERNINYQILGLIIILCSKAYKSAKMRKNNDATNSKLRKIIELCAILISFLLVILQNNLLTLIYTDPFTNLIIPIFAIGPYFYLMIKLKNIEQLQKSDE